MFEKIKDFGSQPALFENGDFTSYEDLDKTSEEIAAAIGRRNLVFLLCKNTKAALAGYVGFIRNKIIPVMIDAAMDQELLKNLVYVYHPEYFWLPLSAAGQYASYEKIFEKDGYALLRACEQRSFPMHEDLALLMTTSGSTGSPKFVRLSYQNLAANTRSIIQYLHITSAERGITNLPMHYVYGLSIINTHLHVGAFLAVTEKSLFQRDFWQFVKEQKITNLAGVPYTYAMMERLRFFTMDVPDLHTLTQAGGKLDVSLHRKFAAYARDNKKRFIVMYGAAEATARMGYLPADMALDKCGSMGIAIPGGRFELIDEQGRVIEEPDKAGELVYYGENVSMGYATKGEDLALGDERHGKLETGDVAIRDKSGCYTIVGRKKRFLKVFGKRVNLQEVEQLVRQTYGSLEVACAGMDDHIYLFVVGEKDIGEIKQFLSEKMGIHPTAFTVKYIQEIPKNASGKTIYRELEKYYDL